MKEIKIIKDKTIYEFLINKRKTITGDRKNELFNLLKEYLNKSTLSEYAKANKSNSCIYIDGRPIDLKNSQVLELSNEQFDLQNEYKLSQKSLFSISLENIFNNIEFIDSINTINILLNDLSLDIENIYLKHNIELIIDNLEINKKNILKLIDISLMKDDLKCNQFDYTLNELNDLKISMFRMIALNNKQISFFILNEFEFSNTILLNELENVYIITVEKSSSVYDTTNKIDFDNEELLYEMYFNSSSNLSFDDYVTDMLERVIS